MLESRLRGTFLSTDPLCRPGTLAFSGERVIRPDRRPGASQIRTNLFQGEKCYSKENQREPCICEYAPGNVSVSGPNTLISGIGNSQVTWDWWSNGILPVCPSGQTLESWVAWSSMPITQAATKVNQGEAPLRMKYRQLLAVAPGVGIAGGIRIK
jgi:hypothetical protein